MSLLADRRVRIAALVAITVLVLDQVTKYLAQAYLPRNEPITVLPFFALTYVRNTGAAFGLFWDMPEAVRLPFFLGVTAVAIAALLVWLRHTPVQQPWMVGALGGILGGTIGNLICRVLYNDVVDFLDVHWKGVHWPTFNVADSAITVGVVLVLLSGLRERA